MHVATWNVNSLSVRLAQVLDWLSVHAIDVLALQELKLTDDKFPAQALQQAGYTAVWFGQKSYNGVALLVRAPGTFSAVQRNIPGFLDDQARVIAATVQVTTALAPIRVITAYFPNGQSPDSDKFAYKLRWLQALRHWIAEELTRHARLILMGDFNITADDDDVWDPVGLRDTIHCTREEREQLQALKDLGLHDAFQLFPQPPNSYSWWDYRQLAFPKNRGLRIDHILISDALKSHALSCIIDRAPRKHKQPSDHAPVVLTLDDR